MPHVIVKLYPGQTEKAKQALAERIAQAVVEETGCKPRAISLAIEEIPSQDWADTVFQDDILKAAGTLYKEPGYNPFSPKDTQEAKSRDLMAFVREAAQAAAREDTSGMFNPMSWLELELEDTPDRFDPFFGRPWQGLTETEKQERMTAIRAVL